MLTRNGQSLFECCDANRYAKIEGGGKASRLFSSIIKYTFSIPRLNNLTIPTAPALPTGPGHPRAGYANNTHCNPNRTKTLAFPSVDGTLLYKHEHKTRLDGHVWLGAEESDTVYFPGTLSGTIAFANDSVLSGGHPLRFGGASYGVKQYNKTDGKYTHTPAHTLTLGVTDPQRDLSIWFPHEDGRLLTTSSGFSTLKELGNLTYLNVDGPTDLRADLTVGNEPSDKITLRGTLFGDSPMKFDGGVEPWQKIPVDVCVLQNCQARRSKASNECCG